MHCTATREIAFSVEFEFVAEAEEFYEKAFGQFSDEGMIDMPKDCIVTASFDNADAAEEFRDFLVDECDVEWRN